MPGKFTKSKQFFEQLSLGLVFDDSPVEETVSPPRQAPQAGKSLHFAGWVRPVLESTTAFLTTEWDQSGALDLSDRMVIVPTRNSGRRLREALAIEAAKFDAAVLPPLVVTPNFLMEADRVEDPGSADSIPAPSAMKSRAIWTAALLDLDLNRYRHLFPVDPVERNLGWASSVAEELLEVWDLLHREGLTFASAGKMLGPECPEAKRWRQLAQLERTTAQHAKHCGCADLARITEEFVKNVQLPPATEHIVVAACANLPNLACRVLDRFAEVYPVEIVIAAPPSHQSWFDAWGNPLPENWREAEIDIPEPRNTIQAAANPAEQAERTAKLLASHQSPPSSASIGVPDSETIAPIEQVLAAKGWDSHDPAGKALRQHAVFYLLEQTHQLIDTGSFEAFRRLLRVPDWLRSMLRSVDLSTGKSQSQSGFLRKMDIVAAESLPDTLADARSAVRRRHSNWEELDHGITWAQNWMRRFNRDDFCDTVIEYLIEVFEKRVFPEDTDGGYPELANHLLQGLDVIRESETIFGRKLSAADRFELLLELIKNSRIYPERNAAKIDLSGWLELLWDDAPHLIVTGMNDSFVPESVISHAYLPDSARKSLRITDNEKRFARDAYLLTVLIESRRASGGRINFIFGRQSVSGDPLRPSRLLFQCPDNELAERTLQHFSGDPKSSPPLSWQWAWKLEPAQLPGDAKIFQRISVTAFRSYLFCPFRFYLRYGLGMEEVETGKSEMNAMEFGNLVHDTLEAFGRDFAARELINPTQIRDCYHEHADQILERIYGKQWTTPIIIQREAARRRLAWWAELEAAQRNAGWRIIDPEAQIGSDEDPFLISGMAVRGRIDRIEKHDQLGFRVLDFKTMSPRTKTVIDFHVSTIKPSENIDEFPEWRRVANEKGRLSKWVDLQLPLYRMALEEQHPGEPIAVGYVTLGNTKRDVALHMWENFDENYLASARQCAVGVVQSIQGCRFWPPAERVQYPDILDELFFGDPREAVEPDFAADM